MATIRFSRSAPNDFYNTLKERVHVALAASGKTRFADGLMLVKTVTFLAVMVGSYAIVITSPFDRIGWVLPFVMLYGVSALLLAINLGHDAAHHALTPSTRLNNLVKVVSFGFLGVDGTLWQLRHNKAHHIVPNVEGADSAVTRNPLLRLSPHQPWEAKHRWQHLYAPLAYAIIVLHSAWRQDFLYILNWKRLAPLGTVKYTWTDYAAFAYTKLFYVTVSLVIPAIVLPVPFWQVLLGYVLMSATVSSVFVFLLIGTHFCEEAEFPEAPGGELPHNWAYHAMVTSVDWSPYSRVAQFLIGGTNAHATHHLFPKICHTHYRQIAPLIEETANEFGVPYNRLTLPQMLRSHFGFLRQMGRQPA